MKNNKKTIIGAGVAVVLLAAIIITSTMLKGVNDEAKTSKDSEEYTEKLTGTLDSYVDYVLNDKRDTVKQEIAYLKFDNDVREKLIADKFTFDGVDMTGIIQYQKDRIVENNNFINELEKMDPEEKVDRGTIDGEYVKAYKKTVGNDKLVDLMFAEMEKLDQLKADGIITEEQYELILNSYFYV